MKVNISDKQKQWIVWGVLAVMIAVAGFLGIVMPIPMPDTPSSSPFSSQALYATKCRFESGGNKITCASGGELELQSGSTLDIQSGATTTLVGTGATFTDLTTTNITGTLKTAAQPNVTSLGTLPLATITDLTTTNITGTLKTAAQPNVTSLGTLPLATITNLTTTNVTGTLATAAQPNITSLGTLPLATITNLTSTNITATNDLISLNFMPSANGSAGAVNYCMSSDCDTGIWYPGDNIIGISTGGVERARVTNTGLSGDNATFTTLTVTNLISQSVAFSATATSTLVDVTARNITVTGPLVAGDGTAAAPAFTFASDPNTGLYNVGANNIGVTTNGVLALDVSATAVSSALPVYLPAGAVGTPELTWTGDTDSGLYRIAANNLGVAVNGAKVLDVGVDGLGVVGVAKTGDGTVSLPSYSFTSDPDTGLYNIGANNIGIATNGVIAMDASASAITFGLPVKGPAEGSGIYNLMVDATAAEINAGHVLVTVPAARAFRLVDVTAVAYGATCTTSTVMSLTATSDLVVYTVANLVRSTMLEKTTTGVALLADGASFTAQAAGADLSVKSDTADTAGCTGVRFVITYALD